MNEENQNEAVESVQTADTHKPRFNWKRSLITIVFVVLAAGAVGGIVWYLMDKNEKDIKDSNDKSVQELQKTITDLKNKVNELKDASKKESATADWKVYQNTQYGFQLTFPESWKGYKFYASTIDGTTMTWYVEVPTNDPNWKTADQTHEAGYYSVFAISAYTSSQWTADQANEIKSGYVGKNANYTFGYSPAQVGPSDAGTKSSDINAIIATFKAL